MGAMSLTRVTLLHGRIGCVHGATSLEDCSKAA